MAAAALLRAAARGEPCVGPHLLVHAGDGSPRQVALTGEVTVGRGATAALRLHDAAVSRLHARFRVGPDGDATVEDLGSKNGVRRNGRPVTGGPCRLQPGDAVVVGATTLVYADPLAGPARPPGLAAEGVAPEGAAAAPAPADSPPRAVEDDRGRRALPPGALLASGAVLLALAAVLLAAG